MARGRGRRDNNSISTTRNFSTTPTRVVHASPSLASLEGPGFTSPQRTVGPSVSQPMADGRRYVPPTARPDVVQFSGIQRAATRLVDKPRRVFEPVRFSLPAARAGARRGTPFKAPKALQRHVDYFVDRQTKALRVFDEPHKIPLCVGRKIRKRIMHALKIAGGKVGRPRRTEESEMHC